MSPSGNHEAIDELLPRVQALAPLIRENAHRAEQDGKPVDRVIAALEETGIFKAFVPRKFDGYEIDPDAFISLGLAVAESCTATGWVTTFYMEHNWMLSQFPQAVQEEVFGKQPYILAPASISPTGTAHVIDGGYRLSGRWAWGTGVMHADWILLNGVVDGDSAGPRLFLVPRSEIEVDENWDCVGMCGTGSNDMLAEDVFVPEHRSEDLIAMTQGRGSGSQWHETACYRWPMLPLLTIAAAIPAIGAAREAVALFEKRLGERTVYGMSGRQSGHAAAQIRLGHASVHVDEAETMLREVGRRLSAWGERDAICPPEERARLRLLSAHVVERCRDVVRSVMEASGAGAQMRSNPMQRLHRDVHTISCHTVFDLDVGAENHGRLLLGLDPVTFV